MNTNQPSAGAVKLADEIQELNGKTLDRHCGLPFSGDIQPIIDRHVAPLVEALETTIRRFQDEKDFEEDCDYQDILAAMQQWKDGKG